MITHQSGAIAGDRKGSEIAVHTFPFSFADPTAVAKFLGRIHVENNVQNVTAGTVFEPVIAEVYTIIDVANDAATSATLSVGFTAATYTDFVNATNTKAATQTVSTKKELLLKADTDLYMLPTYVGTPTVGSGYVVVKLWGVNVTAPNNQSA